MVTLKKIMMIAAGATLVYIAAGQFGFVEPVIALPVFGQDTLGQLREIDAKYVVGPESPLPSKGLAEYKAEISSLQLRTQTERDVVQMKLEMAGLAESLQEFSKAVGKMNSGTDCASGAEVFVPYNKAMGHAKAALGLNKKLANARVFEYLGKKEMAETIEKVVASLEASMEKYYMAC